MKRIIAIIMLLLLFSGCANPADEETGDWHVTYYGITYTVRKADCHLTIEDFEQFKPDKITYGEVVAAVGERHFTIGSGITREVYVLQDGTHVVLLYGYIEELENSLLLSMQHIKDEAERTETSGHPAQPGGSADMH